MNSRSTQKLMTIAAMAISIVAFQNCRIEILGSPGDPITPIPAGAGFSRIEYHANVGYSAQPLYTHLLLSKLNDGSVLADLSTESCRAQLTLSPNDLYRLESQIRNSPRRYLNHQSPPQTRGLSRLGPRDRRMW